MQALFEYQTLICQLTGMEVSNAGVYDGASAAAEAVLMSRRIQPLSRRRVLVSRALHPQYRAVVASYLKNLTDVRLEEIPFDATVQPIRAAWRRRLNDQSDVRAGRLSELLRRRSKTWRRFKLHAPKRARN